MVKDPISSSSNTIAALHSHLMTERGHMDIIDDFNYKGNTKLRSKNSESRVSPNSYQINYFTSNNFFAATKSPA